VVQAWTSSMRIPHNKVCIMSFEMGSSIQGLLCVVVLLLVVVLPWKEPKVATTKTTVVSLNKVCSLVFYCHQSPLYPPPPNCGGTSGFDGGSIIFGWQLKTTCCPVLSNLGEAIVLSASLHGGVDN
jgi:hypothetical protein